MNTKKILFAFAAMLVLVASACTPNTAEDEQLYEQGIKKGDITKTD
ncbi:hypothetical protein [Muriicola marianensis]|uniref:Uncharacterized protein n=1 Tax=Muriicola marianensis TaxID=1324801 RepID=A0ABQ1QQE4_9FLAO|nr:hypothetical protein [Muriicola marianensis]GGD38405.1 hypothetical protein GCM10011361_01940 [Muriicola marianensis]